MKIEQRHKGLVEKRTGVLKTHSIVQENVKEFGLETDVFSHRNVLDQNLHVKIVVVDGGEPIVADQFHLLVISECIQSLIFESFLSFICQKS